MDEQEERKYQSQLRTQMSVTGLVWFINELINTWLF